MQFHQNQIFFWSKVEMEYFGVTMLLKCANPHLSADSRNKSNRQGWIDPEPQLCVVEIVGNVYAVLLEIVQSFWLTFLQFKAVPLVSHCGEGRTFKGTDADCPFGWLSLKLPLHPLALSFYGLCWCDSWHPFVCTYVDSNVYYCLKTWAVCYVLVP